MRLYIVNNGMDKGMGSTFTVTPGMQTVAAAIQKQEGYAPGTLAYTNNNPGNLIYAGQPGAVSGAGGFAVFPSYDAGLNALYNQINLYATGACGVCGGQPMTIGQMTAVYAPAGQGGNNPQVYANNIANAAGVGVDTPLADVIAGTAATPAVSSPLSTNASVGVDDGSGDGSGDDSGTTSDTDNTGLMIAAGVAGLIAVVMISR